MLKCQNPHSLFCTKMCSNVYPELIQGFSRLGSSNQVNIFQLKCCESSFLCFPVELQWKESSKKKEFSSKKCATLEVVCNVTHSGTCRLIFSTFLTQPAVLLPATRCCKFALPPLYCLWLQWGKPKLGDCLKMLSVDAHSYTSLKERGEGWKHQHTARTVIYLYLMRERRTTSSLLEPLLGQWPVLIFSTH